MTWTSSISSRKLLEMSNTDIHKICHHYEIDQSRFARDLTRSLDRFKTGNARTPTLAPQVPRLINEAWSLASIEYGVNRVRSGHLMLALLVEDDFARMMRELSPETQKISAEDLHARLGEIVSGSAEDLEEVQTGGVEHADDSRGLPMLPGPRPLINSPSI
jgi:type VI secretion system protein VasG